MTWLSLVVEDDDSSFADDDDDDELEWLVEEHRVPTLTRPA